MRRGGRSRALVLDNGARVVAYGFEVPGDVDAGLCISKVRRQMKPKQNSQDSR